MRERGMTLWWPLGPAVHNANRVARLGRGISHYGLILVLIWIGGMKFTAYEAHGIQPLVANSPLMGWVYDVTTIAAFSAVLGVVEIGTAVLIALRPVSAEFAALGSLVAIAMFLTTLSFMFSTPGWEPSLGGFPAVSAMPGQFLLKDIVLLGAAVSAFGEALADMRKPTPSTIFDN